MSVKEMYMGREMTGTTTLAESVYNEMGGDTPLITESQTVKGGVNELKTIEGTEAYDNTATYAVGDYCIYNSTRYKCITAVTTAEDFDSIKWSATTTSNDISELNSSIEIIDLTSTDIFTPASGVTMNTRPCYKSGKEIFFTAVFSMSNPVNTTNTLGIFKDGYKPKTQYYSIGMSYASGVDAGSASLVNAGTNGITVEHTGAKAYLVVCAKYITN